MKRFILFIFSIIIALGISACGNSTGDDSTENSVSQVGTLIVDGTEFELTKLYINHRGYDSFSDNYSIDLHLVSEEVSHDGNTSSGTTEGSGVYLAMAFPSDEVTSGTFPFSTNDNDNTFSDFSDAFTTLGSYREYFAGGSLEITIDGSTYTIEGDVTDDNGDQVTFNYTGPVTDEFPADS